MSYQSLKIALEQIAAGAPDPVAVAKEVLQCGSAIAMDRAFARRKAVAEMRSSGKSFVEIGKILGVSSARAGQICAAAKRPMSDA